MKIPTEECPLMVIELFAGIGAQAQALKNAGIPHKVVAIAEIDKNAIKSYMAIHGETENLGDISMIEHLPTFPDNPTLWTYSFPCQDISVAGMQRGFDESSNTRSSLLWEVNRLVQDALDRGCPPDYLLMENVDAILNDKNLPNFNKWIARLADMGYTSSYKVLNSKNFGVPQNRRRCFMMSAREGMSFVFDEGKPTTVRLKDILEEDVDESFYLSDERIAKYEQKRVSVSEAKKTPQDTGINILGNLGDTQSFCQKANVYDPDGVAPTVLSQNRASNGTMTKIEVVGSVKDTKTEMVNRVYGTNGASPTLQATSADVPKIEVSEEDVEMKLAGKLMHSSYHHAQRVFDTEGIGPTICSRDFKEPIKIEVNEPGIIVAGEIDTPFDHAKKVLSTDGVAPALMTTNPGIDMPKIEVVGDLHLEEVSNGGVRNNHSCDVLGTNGISTCLTAAAGAGGGHVPKIEVEEIPIELAGVMTDTKVEQARRVYDPENISPAVTAGGGSGSIPKIEVSGKMTDTAFGQDQQVFDTDGIAPTLRAEAHGHEPLIELNSEDEE